MIAQTTTADPTISIVLQLARDSRRCSGVIVAKVRPTSCLRAAAPSRS